jgi:hypothetical protein
MDCAASRLIGFCTPPRLVLLGMALLFAGALSLPQQGVAANAPVGLESMVANVVRDDARGPVSWARYVETTPDVAAALLGKRRVQLYEELPERVYLVVLYGNFSMPGCGEGRGPYLAFLYSRSRDSWQATDFTLLERPVPLRTAGVPHAVEPFALTHPTLDRILLQARVAVFWFLPPVLLVACAALCLWKRRSRWPCTLALCAVGAVAAWRTFLTLGSLAGQTWDPGFHSVKLAVLVVVLAVDLEAAYLVWRRRSSLGPAGDGRGRRSPRVTSVAVLLLAAAALYVPSLLWLATTGA